MNINISPPDNTYTRLLTFGAKQNAYGLMRDTLIMITN